MITKPKADMEFIVVLHTDDGKYELQKWCLGSC
jgi:hypothetical protein